MAETFHTRIPTLSNPELEEYLRDHSRYDAEAVEAALAELDRRGRSIPADEVDAIREDLRARDAGEGCPGAGGKNNAIAGFFAASQRRVNGVAAAMLLLGLGGALWIYLTAGSAPANPAGYDPMDSKKYLRELEVYGGKANVLGVEFWQWFAGLWHGRSLAWTVAVITGLLTLSFWLVATSRVPADRDS